MRLTLTHMLSFEANASPFSALALDRLPMCSCVHVVEYFTCTCRSGASSRPADRIHCSSAAAWRAMSRSSSVGTTQTETAEPSR